VKLGGLGRITRKLRLLLTKPIQEETHYEIPIDEIRDMPTSELPDWLAQLADKSWMDEYKMGHFVFALHSILDLRTLIRDSRK